MAVRVIERILRHRARTRHLECTDCGQRAVLSLDEMPPKACEQFELDFCGQHAEPHNQRLAELPMPPLLSELEDHEPSRAERQAMLRLARVYLENVPASYLHLAIAIRNLALFSPEQLRFELERRDEKPAFPDPTQLLDDLEALEEQAREAAAAALGVDDDEPPPSETE